MTLRILGQAMHVKCLIHSRCPVNSAFLKVLLRSILEMRGRKGIGRGKAPMARRPSDLT